MVQTSYVHINAGDHLSVADLSVSSSSKSSTSLNTISSSPSDHQVDWDAFEIQRSSSHSEGFYRKESKSSLKAKNAAENSLLKRSPKDGKKSGFLKSSSSGSRTSLSPETEEVISPSATHRKRSTGILNRSDLGPRFTDKEEKEKEKKKKDKRRSWFHQDWGLVLSVMSHWKILLGLHLQYDILCFVYVFSYIADCILQIYVCMNRCEYLQFRMLNYIYCHSLWTKYVTFVRC